MVLRHVIRAAAHADPRHKCRDGATQRAAARVAVVGDRVLLVGPVATLAGTIPRTRGAAGAGLYAREAAPTPSVPAGPS